MEALTSKALIVDDSADMRWLLSNLLKEEGFEVSAAENGENALKLLKDKCISIVLLDLKMPGLNGIETLKRIKDIDSQIPVIIVTAYGEISSAVEAIKLGAYDYITKPFHNEDILLTIKRALERQELLYRLEELKGQLENGTAIKEIMGTSPKMEQLFSQIRKVAKTNFTVILQGETGTGKEIVARAIHQQSDRRKHPFLALDCGAIPETLIESELFGYERGAFTGADRKKEGHFQLATKGTLFLDEISNLPLITQSKLLRVLQEKRVQPLGAKRSSEVDLRIIVASNVLLDEEVREGRFRRDLYHRLNEFYIKIPPLRERKEDILHLAKRFLDETNMELRKKIYGFSDSAMDLLLAHTWPGNVRELKNAIRRAVLLATDIIFPEHLSLISESLISLPCELNIESEIKTGLSLKEISQKAIAEVEKRVIIQTLKNTKGNKSQAAKILKVDYKTLHTKIKEYGILSMEFLP